MPESPRCCLIFLLIVLSGFSSGTEPISKYVCKGDNVQLFQNITFANNNTVSIYVKEYRETLIGTWNSISDSHVVDGYKTKMSLDECGTMWIRDINISEAGIYLLQYDTNKNKFGVQINVMDAPTKHCKPNITKQGNLLMAFLNEEYCGIPQAVVHWLDNPHISIIDHDAVKLSPEGEIGTYHACAETQALRCLKTFNIADYCNHLEIEGHVPDKVTEVQIGKDKDSSPPVSSTPSTTIVEIVTLVLVSFLVICSIIATGCIIMRILNERHTETYDERHTETYDDPQTR